MKSCSEHTLCFYCRISVFVLNWATLLLHAFSPHDAVLRYLCCLRISIDEVSQGHLVISVSYMQTSASNQAEAHENGKMFRGIAVPQCCLNGHSGS